MLSSSGSEAHLLIEQGQLARPPNSGASISSDQKIDKRHLYSEYDILYFTMISSVFILG